MEYPFTDLDKNWQWMQAGKFLRSLKAAEEFGGLMNRLEDRRSYAPEQELFLSLVFLSTMAPAALRRDVDLRPPLSSGDFLLG